MKYVLILLFFTTPPAPHVDAAVRKAKSPWTFQSSSSAEFSSKEACELNGQVVLNSLDMVDTMTGVGWCFCQNQSGTVCKEDLPTGGVAGTEGYTTQMVTPRGQTSATGVVVNQLIPKSLQKAIRQQK